jgi:Skp family chaperone for outer membrane proteins
MSKAKPSVQGPKSKAQGPTSGRWIFNRPWTSGLGPWTAMVSLSFVTFCLTFAGAIEIPLESLTPARVGYVDLQKVFDTYPEKSFAEGDLLREIEKRRRQLGTRQSEVNTLRQQIAADEAALAQAKSGQAVVIPPNALPEPVVAPPAAPVTSSATVGSSTSTIQRSSSTFGTTTPYSTEDPLAGMPGHENPLAAIQAKQDTNLPGMQPPAVAKPLLEQLAASSGPVTLNGEALNALQDRIAKNKRSLDRAIADFRSFRTNAVGDMKVLQTQKTYGVMARIYAVLQNLARDEGVTVVMDKAYVLYGEDAVDLSEKLIERLNQEGV